MADVQDPAILEAYNDVRDDNTVTNWLVLQYESDKSDKLTLKSKGTGGLNEFVDNLQKDQAAFGYVRITISNDDLSQRAKFLLVSWCGSDVKVLRRAKLSVHIANVKSVLKVPNFRSSQELCC